MNAGAEGMRCRAFPGDARCHFALGVGYQTEIHRRDSHATRILKQAEVGVPVVELTRNVGISEQTFYRWKRQYVGLESDQVREMKQLQDENSRLKHLESRPHRALGNLAPGEFASQFAASRELTGPFNRRSFS